MYNSPIEIISSEMKSDIENNLIEIIHSYGINVNKEELLQALSYDRKQYDRGYNDGYTKGFRNAVYEIQNKLNKMI